MRIDNNQVFEGLLVKKPQDLTEGELLLRLTINDSKKFAGTKDIVAHALTEVMTIVSNNGGFCANLGPDDIAKYIEFDMLGQSLLVGYEMPEDEDGNSLGVTFNFNIQIVCPTGNTLDLTKELGLLSPDSENNLVWVDDFTGQADDYKTELEEVSEEKIKSIAASRSGEISDVLG